jgi:hypothetical protein
MFKTEISQCKKVILFALLIVLNLVLRIPSIPHEKGADSFFIHSLANSITSFGYANWWLHWLSVIGYYPLSYASAIPFSLSGISQLTGIELEYTILIFCIIIGLFSIFSAYLLAGVLYDDFLFKYLVALFYSTSPSIMFFSTWEISSRGPFNIFLPVFLYLLMKNIQNTKRVFLLCIVGIFLFSIHHLGIILVPIISIFIAIKLFSKIEVIKIKSTYLNYIYLIGLVIAFALPFLNPSMTGITGSRYTWLSDSMTIITRYIGPMIFFAFSGVVYLALKNDKNINLWYILCLVILFVPFIYNQTYGIHMFQLFIVIILTVGFRNLLNIRSIKLSKINSVFIIAILLSSVIFSAYYNHQRTGEFKDFWYMDDKTISIAEWINGDISKEKRVLFTCSNFYMVRSVALQKNGCSILTGDVEALIYGFIDKNSIKNNLEKVPITESYFYSESPYLLTKKIDPYTSIDWVLENRDVTQIKGIYALNYIVQSKLYPRVIGLSENKNEKIYSDGELEIYDLRSV